MRGGWWEVSSYRWTQVKVSFPKTTWPIHLDAYEIKYFLVKEKKKSLVIIFRFYLMPLRFTQARQTQHAQLPWENKKKKPYKYFKWEKRVVITQHGYKLIQSDLRHVWELTHFTNTRLKLKLNRVQSSWLHKTEV